MSTNVKLVNQPEAVKLSLTTEPHLVIASANYVHTQSTAATTWIVPHNLGKYCSVTVVDENDDVVVGEIHYDSEIQVTLTFTAAFSGKAFCN